MRRLTISISLVFAGCIALACNESVGDCEAARQEIVDAMKEICFSDPSPNGYTSSRFCVQCVTAGYYSTTGASACQCQELTFDTATCAYETTDDAKAAVRAAIDWANGQCANFTPPMAIPPVIEAGGDDASVEAEAGDDASVDAPEQ
jgi:hypothetical protein